MKRTILLRYEPRYILSGLNDEFDQFILHLETTWFWGLFKTTSKEIVKVARVGMSLTKTWQKWDNLIETRKRLK